MIRPLLPPPPLNLIQRKHIRIVVHTLQQLQRIPHPSRNILARPDNKPRPVSLVSLELRRVHDAPDLSSSDDLGIAREGEEVVVCRRDGLLFVSTKALQALQNA